MPSIKNAALSVFGSSLDGTGITPNGSKIRFAAFASTESEKIPLSNAVAEIDIVVFHARDDSSPFY
jgi:hypothetical protein